MEVRMPRIDGGGIGRSEEALPSPNISPVKTPKTKLSDKDVLRVIEDSFFVDFTKKTSNRKIHKVGKHDKVTAKLDTHARSAIQENRTTSLGTKHKVTKEMSSQVKSTAIKAITISGVILFGVIALAAIGITKGIFALKGRIMAKVDPQNLSLATENMKKTEETEKFSALQKAAKDHDCIPHLHNNLTDLLRTDIKHQKLERFLLRSVAKKGEALTPKLRQEIKTASQSLTEANFSSTNALKKALSNVNPQLSDQDILNLHSELYATGDHVEKEAASFNQILKELDGLLKSSSKDVAAVNQQVTSKLREALNSPAYQALKEDPTNQSVQFLHSIASAIWNNVQALDAYKTLGEAALRRVPKDPYQPDPSTGKEMHVILEASHKKASQELLTDHGIPGKILYALKHPTQTLSSMASEGGLLRSVAEVFGKGVYDSHYLLSNNPSLQGVTTAQIATSKGPINASINNCYGGSPTIGDNQISPEFDALCQAAENKQFSSKSDPTIPDVVYYTNFQNIEHKGGEGGRSQTIMNQNQRYPLSFKGMTLAKDSDFYMMKSYKKDPDSIQWSGSIAFGQEMFQRMTDDACFSNSNRTGNPAGNGFYFPGTKEEWSPIFKKCIESAQLHFHDAPQNRSGTEAYELRGAFQEYVYSMVQAHTELKLVKDAGEKGNKNPVMTAIRACKENIDRGGAENTKYMYTRLSPEEFTDAERATLITGVFQSRALSARNRVILDHRLPQVLSFMDHVEPADFQREMNNVVRDLGIQFADRGEPRFKPALQNSP